MNADIPINGAPAVATMPGRLSLRWVQSVVGTLCIAYAAICLSDLPYFFFDSGPLHRVHLNHYVETTRAGLSLHMLSVGPVWLVGLFLLQLILSIQLLRGRDCLRSSLGLYVLVLSASNRAPFLFGAAGHYLALTCLGCAMLTRQSARGILLSSLWMGQVMWASYRCLVLMGPVSLPSQYAPELLGLEAVVWILALQKPHRWLRVASVGIGLAVSAAMVNALFPLNPSRVAYVLCILLMRSTLWFFDGNSAGGALPPSGSTDSSSQVEEPKQGPASKGNDSDGEMNGWDGWQAASLVLACWTVLATCYTQPPLERGAKVVDGTPAVVARELSIAFGLVQDWTPTNEPETLICLSSVRDGQGGAAQEEPFPETQWQQCLRSEHRCMLRKINATELNGGNTEYLRRVYNQIGSGTLESVRVVTANRELIYFRWNAKTNSNSLQDPANPGEAP